MLKKTPIFLLMLMLLGAMLLSGCQGTPAEEASSGSDTPPQSTDEPSQAEPITTLPQITADMVGIDDEMGKALFNGAVAFQLGPTSEDPDRLIIPNVGIYDTYESDGKLNVVCHVALKIYHLNDARTALVWSGTELNYGKAVLAEGDDGTYTCEDFVLAGEGEAQAQDIKEFCGPLTDLPDKIYSAEWTSTSPSTDEMEASYTQATGIEILYEVETA